MIDIMREPPISGIYHGCHCEGSVYFPAEQHNRSGANEISSLYDSNQVIVEIPIWISEGKYFPADYLLQSLLPLHTFFLSLFGGNLVQPDMMITMPTDINAPGDFPDLLRSRATPFFINYGDIESRWDI